MNSEMNISLPAPMKKWVEQQVAKKGYGTADAFFQEMVQRERALEARERIDDLLSEAISEGEATAMTPKDWDRIRGAGMKLARGRRRK
jgi:antitoxin ParD1/3/4